MRERLEEGEREKEMKIERILLKLWRIQKEVGGIKVIKESLAVYN